MEINIFSFSNIFRPYWTGKTTEMQKYHSLVMSVNLLAFLWKNSMTRTVNELLIVGTTTNKSAKSQTNGDYGAEGNSTSNEKQLNLH